MRTVVKNFIKDTSGATLVEYGVALIMAVVMGGGALSLLAQQTDAQIDKPSAIYTDPNSN